jgi:dienelactone hydrolase
MKDTLSFSACALLWRAKREIFVISLAIGAIGISHDVTAQNNAPGVPVSIPRVDIPGLGQSGEVAGTFGRPSSSKPKMPAVLILHGSGGIDGRGAFYARALQEAGIATLEILMFQASGRGRRGTEKSLPHAAAALMWLKMQPEVDSNRIGAMGFSYGGVLSVLMSSEFVQEKLGKDVPRPIAFAPIYPTCSLIVRALSNSQNPLFGYQARMSPSPMLIQVGTLDDFEVGDRPCDPMLAAWPKQASDRTIVRYIDGATHGFDEQGRSKAFYDELARAGRGGNVRIDPSSKDATTSRQAVVQFFVEHLAP